jgi:hypothetical protein
VGVGHALLAGESSIAVEDDADVAWRRSLPYLAKQPALVEVVEKPVHDVSDEAMTERLQGSRIP